LIFQENRGDEDMQFEIKRLSAECRKNRGKINDLATEAG
jgi:hypothetical protein